MARHGPKPKPLFRLGCNIVAAVFECEKPDSMLLAEVLQCCDHFRDCMQKCLRAWGRGGLQSQPRPTGQRQKRSSAQTPT